MHCLIAIDDQMKSQTEIAKKERDFYIYLIGEAETRTLIKAYIQQT